MFVFKLSTLHQWEVHVHVWLLCPHILEHPQNIQLIYSVVYFHVLTGIVVCVFESASVCFYAGF